MAKVNEKKKDLFWLSYSDLMTSLFFVMLVLFVLVYSMQNSVIKDLQKTTEELKKMKAVLDDSRKKSNDIQKESDDAQKKLKDYIEELTVAKKELDRIKEVEKTINNIDQKYFIYDHVNKKHILNVQFLYPTGSANLRKIKPDKRPELVKAGRVIKDLILKFPEEENIKYLLVVEGQASKDNWKGNDKLSYYRAQSLIKFWKENNIGLEKLKNCEIVIAGSGEKGIPRTSPDIPPANQRFLITIIPKIGDLKRE
jgi:hypothetical protein